VATVVFVVTGFVASAAPLARIAATSLTLPATAPAYSYTTEPTFGGLTFFEPTQVVFAPGEPARAYVLERAGRVALVRDTSAPTREIFLDLTAKVGNGAAGTDNGLLSLAFHPQFATNGYFYVWHSLYVAGTRYNRLARYTRSATNPTLADPASELPLITQQTGPGGHDGGTLLFGPDGYLYLSLGDGDSGYTPAVESHQRIDRAFFGCVLRLDVDQRAANLLPNPHPSVHAGTYRIPADNPWIGATTFNGLAVAPSSVRTEFWAVGLRNPFRLAFDELTGALWCADVGLNLREEINLITRGANYGWDYREGTAPGPSAPAAPAGFTSTDPIYDYDHTLGLSITGGVLYRGAKFPELHGRYLFSDYVSGRIWALADNGTRPLPAIQIRQIASEIGLVAFTADPRTGDVLLADLDSNVIRRLVAVTATGPALPATLSATGVFTDLATLAPAPGVVPYAPNVDFWSDHAKKSRWFALPSATTGTFRFDPAANWSLPAGAVWIKHFDLETTRGNPATARRIETRFLVKTADSVYGLSYRWNDAQTDATLVAPDGADATFTITDNGTTRPQVWRFPGRGECLQCHTPAGGYALSFNTRQLNRTFPADPTAHQLTALAAAGYLDVATLPAPTTALPALAPADDIFSSIEKRARSYLDANCAQCHQPGGLGRGNWDARFATATPAANLINGLLIDPRDDSANRVLVPGDAPHSMLLTRLRATNALRMPPLASSELDPTGTALIVQWIASLAPTPADRLTNLAARAAAGLDSDTLTAGFVITSAPKTVLLRAVGPSLTQFGVTGALAQPTLTVRPLNGETILATNTRWSTAANAAALRSAFATTGAFPLPDDSADSALLATLAPGAYTAQATGVGRTTGVALVEAYDADPGAPAGRLANTSVRARVGLDAEILIPGLSIGGTAPRTVLIRAAGPALTGFGVAGALAAPVLKLFSGQQALATNTGWTTAPNLAALRAAGTATGAFAFAENSADSALLVTLPPGGYTIQVSGANRTSGVALIEVYEVP
jgi:uncharacterized repeat protein (TIGR03806 family)